MFSHAAFSLFTVCPLCPFLSHSLVFLGLLRGQALSHLIHGRARVCMIAHEPSMSSNVLVKDNRLGHRSGTGVAAAHLLVAKASNTTSSSSRTSGTTWPSSSTSERSRCISTRVRSRRRPPTQRHPRDRARAAPARLMQPAPAR